MAKKNTSEASPTRISFAGFLKLRCQLFAPQFFLDISGDELKVYLYLLFLSERYPEQGQKALKRASVPYISVGTGIAKRTVDRVLPQLKSFGLLRIVKVDRREGNIYWVNPSFIEPDQSRQFGVTEKGQSRQFGVTCDASPGTQSRQFGAEQPDPRSISTSLIETTESAAARHVLPTDPVPGLIRAFDEIGDLGKGGPSGFDHKIYVRQIVAKCDELGSTKVR